MAAIKYVMTLDQERIIHSLGKCCIPRNSSGAYWVGSLSLISDHNCSSKLPRLHGENFHFLNHLLDTTAGQRPILGLDGHRSLRIYSLAEGNRCVHAEITK